MHIIRFLQEIKHLSVVFLTIFLFQHKVYASDDVELYGKWTSCTYVSLPDNSILNDSTRRAYGIIPIACSHFYFYENDTGVFLNPAREETVEFKWHLANDTIHILHNDTLIIYKIDKKNIRTDTKELYLRLLSKETKVFPFSYVIVTDYFKPSKFVMDPLIRIKELDDDIRETINDIKEKRRIDEVIIGYEKDEKYYYTYLFDYNEISTNGIFDDIQNWKNGVKFVLSVIYDDNMNSLQRISRLTFEDDKYLPERVSLDSEEDFPITRNAK